MHDRYPWLDEETAERLLRGLSVEGPHAPSEGLRPTAGPTHSTDHNPTTGRQHRHDPNPSSPSPSTALSARRLAAALDDLAHAHPPAPEDGPALPGEEAALAAFRESHPPVARTHAPRLAGARDAGRLSLRRRTHHRLPGLRRQPVRASLALALASCALGGVAVAAGTGLLPTPFGGGGTRPAASVAPDQEGRELDRGQEQGDPASRTPGHGDGNDKGDSGDSHDGSHPADPREDLADSGRDSRDRPGGSDSATPTESGEPSDGPARPTAPNTPPKELPEEEKRAIAVAFCDAYEGERLTPLARRQLERAAGGERAVEQFCDEHGEDGGDEASNGGTGDGGADTGGGSDSGGESTDPTNGGDSGTGDKPSNGGAIGGDQGDTSAGDTGGTQSASPEPSDSSNGGTG
ncbi:hypothetical protein [Streptomyces sp. NPDC005438]|uniref:hypothetical protein n=1 Tax=Streptomyces sp. NPDC005438 TaxID=3156880 RepID=UPI0033BA4FA4